MLSTASVKQNISEQINAASVCRNACVMSGNNTAADFGDTSFGVSFFAFFRFFLICFYYFYYFALHSKSSTARLKA